MHSGVLARREGQEIHEVLADVGSLVISRLGRRSSPLELSPEIEQIEPAPLFDQLAAFDRNDRREGDGHSPPHRE